MTRRHNWDNSTDIGKVAVRAVTDFLNSPTASNHLFQTRFLYSVEDDPHFRKQEIDLLWVAPVDGTLDRMTVEVKGDRNDKSGNFFIETVSDTARNTVGAFLACQADWFFYYFVSPEILYCMPTEVTRDWFLKNLDRFPERETGSRRGKRTWQTLGRLVPIHTLISEVGCVPSFRRSNSLWHQLKVV